MRSQRALAFGILAGVLAVGFGGALTSFGHLGQRRIEGGGADLIEQAQ